MSSLRAISRRKANRKHHSRGASHHDPSDDSPITTAFTMVSASNKYWKYLQGTYTEDNYTGCPKKEDTNLYMNINSS